MCLTIIATSGRVEDGPGACFGCRLEQSRPVEAGRQWTTLALNTLARSGRVSADCAFTIPSHANTPKIAGALGRSGSCTAFAQPPTLVDLGLQFAVSSGAKRLVIGDEVTHDLSRGVPALCAPHDPQDLPATLRERLRAGHGCVAAADVVAGAVKGLIVALTAVAGHGCAWRAEQSCGL